MLLQTINKCYNVSVLDIVSSAKGGAICQIQ